MLSGLHTLVGTNRWHGYFPSNLVARELAELWAVEHTGTDFQDR